MRFSRPGFSSVLVKLLTVVALGSCAGCTNSSPTTLLDDQRIHVVATTAMVGDVVRGVGGDRVDVTVLLGPGVDPHLYKTTRDDIEQIMAADIVFYSGLMLEGKMTDTLVKIGRSRPVYAVTGELKPDDLITADSSEHASTNADPHVWFDIGLWGRTSVVVARALAGYDPEHADAYLTAAQSYQSDLTPLNEYGRKVIASIPEDQRILITSHDAFGYLGRAYGLEVMGIQGISTESEAGLRRVNELVDLLVDQKIPAVFVESSVPTKSIEALIDGARSRGHHVRVGGELYSDAAGPSGTYEGTYQGMLDHNFTLIARGLGGEAPAKGLAGRLDIEP